jgi:hypothetical protein
MPVSRRFLVALMQIQQHATTVRDLIFRPFNIRHKNETLAFKTVDPMCFDEEDFIRPHE